MSEPTHHEDKFIAMVTAKAEVNLRLERLRAAFHAASRPRTS